MNASGAKIARRAAAFDMPVGYCTRTERPEVEHRWFDTPVALAAWCDFLVVATPGGAATRHLVNADLLEFDQVVLTPHVAGTSPEAVQATIERFIDNSTRHFSGQPLASPV